MKSKVLLVSKFYYRRGGACVYVLNLERLLLDRGHEVAVFAMDYGLNEPSRWSGFFAPEVKFFGRDAHLLPAARRVLGIGDVKARFSAIVDRVRPDVVHLNNIHSYLSPVVAAIAHER
ncbi:glycosyltransferase, partial [uncultured Muribaculum sp.]